MKSSTFIVSTPRPSRVVFNREVGPGWYVLRLGEPQIAAASRPGTFVQIRCNDGSGCDPILRRPFSVYCVDRSAGTYDVLYTAVGRGTGWMAGLPDPIPAAAASVAGNEAPERASGVGWVDVEGPFGVTFTPPVSDDQVYLVAGGVGVAPLYFLALELLAQPNPPTITLCMGARSRALLQGIDEFRKLPVRTESATDDGSEGFHGRVTGLLASLLEDETDLGRVKVYGCGPQGMNESLRALAMERRIWCEICLESIMACGFGICFGCVAPIRKEADGDYFNRRICCEGPVFDARLLCPGIDGTTFH